VRIQDIIEIIPVPVFCKDHQGIFTACNQAFVDYKGLPRDAIIGKSGSDLAPPRLAEQYQAMDEALIAQGAGATKSIELDSYVNGGKRRVSIHKATLHDAAGTITGLLGIIFDVTELRRTEHTLKTVYRACPDMVAVSDRQTGEYLSVNDAFERVLGFTNKELLGRTSTELGIWPTPEERARVLTAFASTPRLLSFESVFRRKTGELVPILISLERVDLDGRDCVVSIAQDITDRKRDEESLQLAASVFHSSLEGMLITDLEGTILSVNPAFAEITGWSAEEAIGRNPRFLKSGYHNADFFSAMWRDVATKRHWQGEIWNRHRNGEPLLLRETISMVVGADGKPLRYVGIFNDITELRRMDARIHHMAFHDLVTGLPNRALLVDRLEHYLEVTKREERNLAVMFCDLDRFKYVNDTLGHDSGDELLKAVSARLLATVRGTDTVCRLGGDEFVFLLDNPSDEAEVAQVAQRIIAAVNRPLELSGKPARVGASIGIAMHPLDGDTSAGLMKNADTAMYAAKAAGGNTFRFFNAQMTRHADELLKLEADLSDAVRGGGFELFYQPKICLQCLQPRGAEALIRWRHDERGLVAPGDFIPFAEECGLIMDIGDWVLRDACRTLAKWRQRGFAKFKTAINLSPAQLRESAVADRVQMLLDNFGIEGGQLEVELTESAIMADPEQAVAALERIRALGVTVAVDDFGTGYSSLSYLKRLPLDTIKIDRSFIAEVRHNVEDAEIVRTILALAKALRRTVVAEGVETADQVAFLRAAGCDFAQGFHFAPPMPEGQFEQWLADRQLCCGDCGEHARDESGSSSFVMAGLDPAIHVDPRVKPGGDD
jgi:diguanylate cyclase (GGDEF)-like protein/PAS domain S-box-containing protein